MPLPSRPGSSDNNNNNDENKNELKGPPIIQGGRLPISRPNAPQQPVAKDDSIPLSAPPEKLSRSLDARVGSGDDYTNRRRDLSGAEAGTYQMLSNITAEEVINASYDKSFKRLEDEVKTVKIWLQEYITENGLVDRVGSARSERGEKLYEVKKVLDQILLRYFAQNPWGSQQDVNKITSLVLNEILGYGPLEPLWGDKSITEIMVNGPQRIYIERQGRIQRARGVQFRDANHLLELCQQLLQQIGRVLDIAHPKEDGRLQDGSRINATHPIIGPGGPYLTIRRFPEEVFTLRTLIEKNSFTNEMAEEVGNLVFHKSSIIVSGGTGSGKTSMLNALSGCIPNDERIITIEDSLELRVHPDRHVVSMETRKSLQGEDSKSTGNVTIRDLVKNALRQRPDRIVVGEVRDGAAYDMLQAFNTGHEGSMSTIHANNPRAAVERLSNLIAQVGELSSDQALTLISSGVDLIVQVARFEDGSRRVSEIAEIPSRVEVVDGKVVLEPITLFEFVQTGTTEDNKIIGEYQRVNDLSDDFVKLHRLNNKRRLSLEELLELSDLPKEDEDS